MSARPCLCLPVQDAWTVPHPAAPPVAALCQALSCTGVPELAQGPGGQASQGRGERRRRAATEGPAHGARDLCRGAPDARCQGLLLPQRASHRSRLCPCPRTSELHTLACTSSPESARQERPQPAQPELEREASAALDGPAQRLPPARRPPAPAQPVPRPTLHALRSCRRASWQRTTWARATTTSASRTATTTSGTPRTWATLPAWRPRPARRLVMGPAARTQPVSPLPALQPVRGWIRSGRQRRRSQASPCSGCTQQQAISVPF